MINHRTLTKFLGLFSLRTRNSGSRASAATGPSGRTLRRASGGADLRSANAQIECLPREALARRGVKVLVGETPKRGRPPKVGEG